MALDARGDIAIVQIVFYIPILFASLLITYRHGFARRAGWIFLLILSLGMFCVYLVTRVILY